MQKKFNNMVHLEGILYDANLEQKVTGPTSKNPGTPYIRGSISVAVDPPECVNVIEVHFRYVTEITASGKNNPTFNTLNNIVNGNTPVMMKTSYEEAARIIVNNSALTLNDFYSTRNNQAVAAMRTEGGFLSVVSDSKLNQNPAQRNMFNADMLINAIEYVEENPDTQTSAFVRVKGAIFPNFGEVRLLPWTMVATAQDAQDYFLGLSETVSVNDPIILNVRGEQNCTTTVRKITDDSAFGTYVREVPINRRDYVITSVAAVPLDFGSEEVMTKEDLKQLIANRNLYLAEIKQNAEERAQSVPNMSNTAPAASALESMGTADGAINKGDYIF